MKKKIIGICVLTLLIGTVIPLSAQNITSDYEKYVQPALLSGGFFNKYGGSGTDAFKEVDLTHDGCYIAVGETQVGDTRDAWMVKIDSVGEVIWEITHGTSAGWDGLFPVITTSDGGYLGGGWFYNSSQEDFDALLIKTNEDGEVSWIETYGGEGRDEFFGLLETGNGYFCVGISFSFSDSKNGYLAKVDFDGNLIWQKIFEKEGFITELDEIIVSNENDGYILCGGYSNPTYPPQGWILKIDEEGNVIWDNSFGKPLLFDWCTTIANTNDDCYIVAGGTRGGTLALGFIGTDIWLMKVDNEGNMLWEKNHGVPLLKDYSLSVQPTSDGGFVFTGHTIGIGGFGDAAFAAWSKIWLVKTDQNGDINWSKRMAGNGHGRCVKVLPDDGFLISGYEGEGHASNSEYAIMIRTDQNGDI